MTTFLVAAVVFVLAITAMAVGVIFSDRRIKGSCGGLAALKDGQGNPVCDACTDPPEECRELKRAIEERGLTKEQAVAEMFPGHGSH